MTSENKNAPIDPRAAFAREFAKTRDALITLLEHLILACANRSSTQDLHWGHVGDLKHVNIILAEALAAAPKIKRDQDTARNDSKESRSAEND